MINYNMALYISRILTLVLESCTVDSEIATVISIVIGHVYTSEIAFNLPDQRIHADTHQSW